MPQLISAAQYHGLAPQFFRCAYHANVMNALEQTSSKTVVVITCISAVRSKQTWVSRQGLRSLADDHPDLLKWCSRPELNRDRPLRRRQLYPFELQELQVA